MAATAALFNAAVAFNPSAIVATDCSLGTALQQFSLDSYEFSEDMEGLLLATFFNDRLMQLIFYPTNCEGYAAHFSLLGAPKQSVEFIYDLDYRGTCYASWSDKKLQAEYDYSIR